MSKVFDWRLSLAIDRAVKDKENARTTLAKIFYAWRLRQLEKRIPKQTP
jgi:hypothetical protein